MRGFTLIELILVIVIIGVVATLTTIELSWWMRESKLTEYRDRLLADLEDIKIKSIASYPYGIICKNNGYEIVVLKDLRCSNDTTKMCVPESSVTDCGGSGLCTVIGNFIIDAGETYFPIPSPTNPLNLRKNYLIDCPNGVQLWFDRKGIPRSSNWGTIGRTFTIYYDENGNGAFDPGELNKTISIDIVGRIRYE